MAGNLKAERGMVVSVSHEGGLSALANVVSQYVAVTSPGMSIGIVQYEPGI